MLAVSMQLVYTYPVCHIRMDVYLYTGQQWDRHMAMVEAVGFLGFFGFFVFLVLAAMVCL